MRDVQTMELEALLNYMYKGEVDVLQETLSELVKTAEALQIKGLAVPDDEAQNVTPHLEQPVVNQDAINNECLNISNEETVISNSTDSRIRYEISEEARKNGQDNIRDVKEENCLNRAHSLASPRSLSPPEDVSRE